MKFCRHLPYARQKNITFHDYMSKLRNYTPWRIHRGLPGLWRCNRIGKIKLMHENLFCHAKSNLWIKTRASARVFARNTRLENQETVQVATCQAKSDARFAESLCQERHAMTKKIGLSLTILLTCIAVVVTAWYDQDQETSRVPSQAKRHLKKNMKNYSEKN